MLLRVRPSSFADGYIRTQRWHPALLPYTATTTTGHAPETQLDVLDSLDLFMTQVLIAVFVFCVLLMAAPGIRLSTTDRLSFCFGRPLIARTKLDSVSFGISQEFRL